MANVKFTEFPSAATVGSTDIIPIVQGGTNKKATAAVFSTYIGSAFVALTGNQTIAGVKTFSSQLASSVATGTAPFSIASTTKVTNLNADLLDGYTSADFQLALTNPVTGTGTTNYLPKFTGTSALGNSLLQENATAIGLGVTPNVWDASFKALQIGSTGILASGGSVTNLGHNYYFDGTNAIYLTTSNASLYQQTTGQHIWYNAPSGTAGNAISFTQAMTLTASGQLGIGTASPTTKLGVAGDITLQLSGAAIRDINNNALLSVQSSNELWLGGGGVGFSTIFYAGAAERMRITSGGNVGIGSTNPYYSLDLTGQTIRTARIYSASTDTRLYFQNTTSGAPTTDAGLMTGLVANDAYFYNYQAGNSIFATSGTERMRITLGGNVLIGTTTDAGYKLDVNGTARVQSELRVKSFDYPATYNTSLRSNSSAVGILQLGNNNDNYILAGNTGTGGYLIFRVNCTTESITSGIEALRLASTGVATFNSGTSNQNTTISGSKVGMSRTSDGAEVVYFSKNTDLGADGTANINGYNGIQFRTQGAETVKLTIAENGAATFSSSVTATRGIFQGSTGETLTAQGIAGEWTANFRGSASTSNSYGLGVFAGTNSTDVAFGVYNQAITENLFVVKGNGTVNMPNLPTSATGLSAGDIWNDGGTLKIV